jgi:hypothetical protein
MKLRIVKSFIRPFFGFEALALSMMVFLMPESGLALCKGTDDGAKEDASSLSESNR